MSKVFLKEMSDQLASDVSEALAWLGWDLIPNDARIFVKPNLTWSTPMAGVTTSPVFIEAVVAALRERSQHITVGESDGGYHSFKAEEAFLTHGLYDLVESYGVRVVNLSHEPAETISCDVAGKRVSVELPSLLLRETDVFITLPVPKVHAMTRVSLGFKNQWGCMPDPMRLRNHAQFPRKVVAINKLLKPRLAIFDGSHVLDKTGPTIGDPIRLNLLLASDDVGAGSLAWCRIMNIDPTEIKHFLVARKEGMFPAGLHELELNQPLEPFAWHKFHLERTLAHWLALAAFNSRILTKIIYDSPLAQPLHDILYAVRRNRFIARLLYGDVGPPPAQGGRSHPPR